MNEAGFIPAWAEQRFKPKDATAFDMAELQMLREFHDAFEAMQAIPGDKLHKNKRDAAAKVVIEKVQAVRRIRNTNGT